MNERNHRASRIRRWARRLIWQLPDQPYPSGHPWSQHHGGGPVG